MLRRHTALQKQKLLAQAERALEAKNTKNPHTPRKAPEPTLLQDGGNGDK
jgi:hypothetical protein